MSASSRTPFIVALAALAITACASEKVYVTPAWEKHHPTAILVAPIDRSGHPEVVAAFRSAANHELTKLGYGTLDSTASMHIVIEKWTSPAELLSFGCEDIEVEARLYDNGSGELLWTSGLSWHESAADDDEDEHESVTEAVVDWLFGWISANAAGTPNATSPKDVAASLMSTLPPRPEPAPTFCDPVSARTR